MPDFQVGLNIFWTILYQILILPNFFLIKSVYNFIDKQKKGYPFE